jgi:two-component sensor histidine kinase
MSLWDWLFNPSGLTAHGFCLSWAPGLIALHAISDGLIGVAYFSIPLALAWFVRERRDLTYSYGWVIYLFVAFILACGATHLFSILTLWIPAYGVEGVVKAITAALSIATAAALWPLAPKLLALPSPDQLRQLNGDLERRVDERTAALQTANLQLTQALEQRDLLLREVYHRVKNNLQTVDALLQMQARRTEDVEAREGLMNLRSRIYALGLVHQQLMGSDNLTTFDIAPFLEELSTNILQGAKHNGVTLSVEACPLNVGLDFAIPVGLLVTELVTNSLKHAFPDGVGHIVVSLVEEEDRKVLLTIADNGRGQTETGSGLGRGIIKGLVAQLDGVMRVIEDGGLRTEIRAMAPSAA